MLSSDSLLDTLTARNRLGESHNLTRRSEPRRFFYPKVLAHFADWAVVVFMCWGCIVTDLVNYLPHMGTIWYAR